MRCYKKQPTYSKEYILLITVLETVTQKLAMHVHTLKIMVVDISTYFHCKENWLLKYLQGII